MSSRRNFVKSTALLSSLALLNQSFTGFERFSYPSDKIKPKRLKPGDTVVITSPAGAVWDEAQIEKFSNILKGFGFKVLLGGSLSLKTGYFAGTDEERAEELNTLFANTDIQGIFCMKGGWGCARILELLDYKTISKNPK